MGEGEDMLRDMLTRESVAAVFAMTCSADLDSRRERVAKREDVPDERLIPFIAIMPDNLTVEERQQWVKEVAEGLDAVAADAGKSIAVGRTIEMMKDLGLGEDGDGNARG